MRSCATLISLRSEASFREAESSTSPRSERMRVIASTMPKVSGRSVAICVRRGYSSVLRSSDFFSSRLEIIEADFTTASIITAIGQVDVVILFDVLLHQANPDWNEVLASYSRIADCLVIYNQQFIRGTDAIRLTNLPLEEYVALASDTRYDFYKYVFDHRTEIPPQYKKRWGDIHNLTQWGITDRALREAMRELAFKEVHYENFGRFLNLPAFEALRSSHDLAIHTARRYSGGSVRRRLLW